MSEEKTKRMMSDFIGVLFDADVSDDTIEGIGEMMWGNKPAIDELVDYIKNNPSATEAQITKKASIIMGISKGDA